MAQTRSVAKSKPSTSSSSSSSKAKEKGKTTKAATPKGPLSTSSSSESAGKRGDRAQKQKELNAKKKAMADALQKEREGAFNLFFILHLLRLINSTQVIRQKNLQLMEQDDPSDEDDASPGKRKRSSKKVMQTDSDEEHGEANLQADDSAALEGLLASDGGKHISTSLLLSFNTVS